jgi:5-methylthioribose kinase
MKFVIILVEVLYYFENQTLSAILSMHSEISICIINELLFQKMYSNNKLNQNICQNFIPFSISLTQNSNLIINNKLKKKTLKYRQIFVISCCHLKQDLNQMKTRFAVMRSNDPSIDAKLYPFIG